MPTPTQHVVILRDPDVYFVHRLELDKFGKGIDAIFSAKEKASVAEELQSIRFDASKYTSADVDAFVAGRTPGAGELAKSEIQYASESSEEYALAEFQIIKPGRAVSSEGVERNWTEEELVEMVDGFAEELARGADPADFKFTHEAGTEATKVGFHRSVLRDPASGWLLGQAWITGEKPLELIRSGKAAVSAEVAPEVDAYGKRIYSWILDATALLPPGDKPAIAGAGARRFIAGVTGRGAKMHRRTMFFAADGAGGGGAGDKGTDEAQTLEQVLEQIAGLVTRLGALEEKVGTLAESKPAEGDDKELGKPDAKDARISELEKKVAELTSATDAVFVKEELDKLQTSENYCLTKGRRDELEAVLLKSDRSTASAVFLAARAFARPLDKKEVLHASKIGVDGIPAAREAHIKEIAEREHLDLSKAEDKERARWISMNKKPELW